MNTLLDPTRRAAIREGALEALFELPESIGRYEIRGELGRGGMGVVYDAFDPNLSRHVAIKVIDVQRLAEAGLVDRELHQRFEREMRATSHLFHPNLVTILDAGVARVGGEPRAYYLMERIEGESLELRLRRAGPMAREQGLRVAAAIARGLAAVHQEGLVHRDLKPSNILLPKRGEAKLTDFGLCQWRPDPLDDDMERGIVGSPHYLSPEQVTRANVDLKADLFSLGTILIHIFTGAPPFAATSLSAHLGRIVSDAPDGLRQLDHDVRNLVSELLAKDPSDRPESATIVAERLEALAGATEIAARWKRGVRRTAIGVGLVAAVTASVALWAHRDLARLEAESQQHRKQLEAQLERSRALTSTLTALADSMVAGSLDERRAIRDEVTGTLNRIAVERRRYNKATARLSARLNALPWSLLRGLLPDRSQEEMPVTKFPDGRQLSDPEGHLSAQQATEVEEQLKLLKRELGVDARVLFITPPADEPFEDFGARAFESLGPTGSGPGERGLLFLVDVANGRSRIEVGYELEPHLLDAMAGALAREHLMPIEMDRLGLDLRLTLRVVQLRLRSALLAGTFPPPLGADPARGYGAGGAGASASIGDRSPTLPIPLERSARSAYAAGPSVRETYSRYLDWLQHGGFDVSVGIFTADTRALLSQWRPTPVYLDLMSRSHPEGPVAVLEREQMAMLYAMSDPLAPPHFFQRGAEGWQIDLASRERHVIAIAGGSFTWTLRRIEAHPLAAFRAELEPVDGLIRIRGGANRPLPIDTAPAGAPIAIAGS
jgi:serine/threonine-protein kinase